MQLNFSYNPKQNYKYTYNSESLNNKPKILQDQSAGAVSTKQSVNFKSLYYNPVKIHKVSFGQSLEDNLHSWGATYNENKGTKFKVWARWADQVFVQAVPADKQDPTEADRSLPKHAKAFPWHCEAEKIGFELAGENGQVLTDENGRPISLHRSVKEQTMPSRAKKINIPDSNKGEVWELTRKTQDGVFESEYLPQIEPGYKYRYILVNSDGNINYKHDPNSYWLDNINSWSTVVNHKDFDWGEVGRAAVNNNPNILNAPNLEAFAYNHDRGNASQISIQAVHLGTVSEKGGLESAKKYVRNLKKNHPGVTHIEIMPQELTYSMNWGYDGIGTGKFAATPHYGAKSPEALKDFIKFTQEQGLGVIIDMVPNHYSHDFSDHIKAFGPYESMNEQEKESCKWGKLFNFEGKENKRVRNFLTRMALNWLVNYNANGLRLDMTKFMHSDNALKQMSQEVRYHVPDAILIAEDGRDDDGFHCHGAVTNQLSPEEDCRGQDIDIHNQAIEKTASNGSSTSNIGLDSQWGFPIQHTVFALVSGRDYPLNERYKPDINKLENMFKDSSAKTNVVYPMSHDEIGNLDGTRLIAKVLINSLDMHSRVLGAEGNPGHNTAQAAQKMLETYYNEGFCNANEDDAEQNKRWIDFQRQITYKERECDLDGNYTYKNKTINVVNPVSLKDFKKAVEQARASHKLALGTVYAFPAPKMLFQGDEYGAIEPFYFFRDEPPGYDLHKVYSGVRREKGYDYGIEKDSPAGAFNAYERSKLHRDSAPAALKSEYDQMEAFTKKLEELYLENPALKEHKNDWAHLQTYAYTNNRDKVLQVYRKDGNGNHILIVMNFGEKEYDSFLLKRNEDGDRPTRGNWIEEINSDDSNYGGSGQFVNKNELTPDANGSIDIKIPSKGFIVLKRKA